MSRNRTITQSVIGRVLPMGVLLACAGMTSGQTIHYVDEVLSPGAGDSWATAFNDISDALAAAVAGDEIRIGEGKYDAPASGFEIFGPGNAPDPDLSGLQIRGGFAGNNTNGDDPDDQDPVAFPTEISGAMNSSQRLFSFEDVGAGTLIEGLILTDGGNFSVNGGGVIAFDSQITFRWCTIENCVAFNGGGMFVSVSNVATGDMVIEDCDFRNNGDGILGSSQGGGLYYTSANAASNLAITRCIFENNDSGAGGAIFFSTIDSPALLDCQFITNIANTSGGAISGFGQSMDATNCLFTGNSSRNKFFTTTVGGAVEVVNGNPHLTNCTIHNNESGVGGGVFILFGTATMNNCILWANVDTFSPTVEGEQVAIGGFGTSPTINHSVVQGLTSSFGVMNTAADPLFELDLHLMAGSPAIDTGNNAAIAGIAADLDGNARIQGGTVDMGPFEFNGTIDTDSDGIADEDDNCPTTPNADQKDTDGDGQGDACDDDDDDDGLLDTTEITSPPIPGCLDPLNPDSDGDTLSDGFEALTLGTNPCDPDTDGDGVPDNLDDLPLDPGVSEDLIVEMTLSTAIAIDGLDLGFFSGPNANANSGRQNSLASRVRSAAKALTSGNESSALALLTSVLERVDGESPPADWMDDTSERQDLEDEIILLINLILL